MNDDEHSDKGQSCDEEPSITEEEYTNEATPKAYEEEKPPKPFIKWPSQVTINTISTVVIAFFTATLWFSSCNQLDSMREQTDAMNKQLVEIQKGSADTKTIAESAKAQADNTKALATAAIDQVRQLAAGVEETKKLALATQDSLSIAKDTAKRQLRAYVAIGRMDLQRFGVNNIAHIEGVIENIGQTPAHDAGWESGIWVIDHRMKPTFTYDGCSVIRKMPEYPRWSFGKKSPVERDRPTAFTADEIKRIQDGSAAIYFHGRLCYLDIFEEEHFTDFCVYWKWENGRLGIGIHCPKTSKST